ncbi:unnamed protein product [Echinostoma caproni]|uniref:Protein AAR2 homolog n=1 Tax=Echinostoma caproni TaxID=27848 RepID=A0A183B904_9TREM|nr:unnamed protein product [Echinostoma caproni]
MNCCLILRDVPENTELGIDMKFWRTGKNFRGIKEIPLGFHYIYFSAVNADCKSGQRTGFGIWVTQPGFVVKQWIPEEEDFIDVQLNASDVERYMENFEEISLYLGPYPSECHRDWVSLTSLITPCTIDRLLPLCGRVQSCTQFLSEASCSQQRLNAVRPTHKLEGNTASGDLEDLLPKLDVVPGTEVSYCFGVYLLDLSIYVRFTLIPKIPLLPPNCPPADVTAYSMDRSYTLNAVLLSLSAHGNPEWSPNRNAFTDTSSEWAVAISPSETELLAELQGSSAFNLLIIHYGIVFHEFSYLSDHVMDGWNQWRRILQLVANCEQAVCTRPHFYMGLITVLYHQLFSASQSRRAQSDTVDTVDTSTAELVDLFFSEITSSDPNSHLTEPAFLPSVMRTLLRNVLSARASSDASDESSGSIRTRTVPLEALQKRAEGFCHSLEQRFHWGLKPDALKKESEPTELLVDDIDWDGDEAPTIVKL